MSQEIFQKIVNDAEKQQCHVTHCSIVLKIRGRGGKDSRVLIISDVFISYYRVKKSPSRDRTMYWPFLTRISVKDNVIELYFGEETFRFETQETNLIIRKIFSIIQRVLSKESFSNLNIQIPPSIIPKELSANGRGILSRFVGYCYKAGIQKMQTTFSVLKQCLSQHNTYFDFSSVDVGSAISPLIRTLCRVPFCESISISRLDKNETANAFSTLIKYGSQNLQHILIKGQIPNEFWTIISKLNQTPKVHLTGISFLDCNITEKDLTPIQQLMISKKMKSISLQNSLLFTKYSMPYSSFFIPPLTEHLLMLNLDRTPRLNIEQLFPLLTNIYSLSLSGCELDIITVLNCINQQKMDKLILLNLSNNFCKSNFSELKFPRLLLRLDVNGISFDSNKISLFFENIMNNNWNSGLILSMSSIKTTESDWNDLFERMGKIEKVPLLRLTWTDNQIDHNSFYTFLSNCIHLQYLNISRCLTSNLPSVFYKINCSIANLPLLNTIILTGHERCPLQNALEPFLTNIISLRSLRILDISNNLIDNNTFHYVAKLLSKNLSIHTINLDNSQIESLDPYNELINICIQKVTPVYISWPSNDISRLFTTNKISVSDIANFTESLQKIRKVFYDKDCIPNTKMPLEEPFEVFKIDHINQFPNYVSDEVSEIFIKTENQANEYEAFPSSPMMLSMFSQLNADIDSILPSTNTSVTDLNQISLISSKSISKTSPRMLVQEDVTKINGNAKSSDLVATTQRSSTSATSNDDDDLVNDNDFIFPSLINNNNNNNGSQTPKPLNNNNNRPIQVKQRLSIPKFSPANPNEKRKFSYDKNAKTNGSQHTTFNVPLALIKRKNNDKKRTESPHVFTRAQGLLSKRRISHSSLNIKAPIIPEQNSTANSNDESSTTGFVSSEITDNTSSSIQKESRKIKQVANPIKNLPNQDELEKLEADIEKDDNVFGSEFVSLTLSQRIKKNEISNQKSNQSLNDFQEKESDEDDFSFNKSSQPNQKPLLQLAPVNVNQNSPQKKLNFKEAFANYKDDSSDFDDFEWEGDDNSNPNGRAGILQLSPSKSADSININNKDEEKVIKESFSKPEISLNQFVDENSDDDLFSTSNESNDKSNQTAFKPLIQLESPSKDKNDKKADDDIKDLNKKDPLSQFQESDESNNEDEDSFGFDSKPNGSQPLIQLNNNSVQQKNEEQLVLKPKDIKDEEISNEKSKSSENDALAQFKEDEEDSNSFDFNPSTQNNSAQKPLLQLAPVSPSTKPKKVITFSSDDELPTFINNKKQQNDQNKSNDDSKINNQENYSNSDSDLFDDLKKPESFIQPNSEEKVDIFNTPAIEKDNKQKTIVANTVSPANFRKFDNFDSNDEEFNSGLRIGTSKLKLSDVGTISNHKSIFGAKFKPIGSDHSSSSIDLNYQETINQNSSSNNIKIDSESNNESNEESETRQSSSIIDNKENSSRYDSEIENTKDGNKGNKKINLNKDETSNKKYNNKKNYTNNNKKDSHKNLKKDSKKEKINNNKKGSNRKKNYTELSSDSSKNQIESELDMSQSSTIETTNQEENEINPVLTHSSDWGFSSENSVALRKRSQISDNEKSKIADSLENESDINKVIVNSNDKIAKKANPRKQEKKKETEEDEGWSNGLNSESEANLLTKSNKTQRKTDSAANWSNSNNVESDSSYRNRSNLRKSLRKSNHVANRSNSSIFESDSSAIKKSKLLNFQNKKDASANWSNSNDGESDSNNLRKNNLQNFRKEASISVDWSNSNNSESDSISLNRIKLRNSQRKSNPNIDRSNKNSSESESNNLRKSQRKSNPVINKSNKENESNKSNLSESQRKINSTTDWSNSNESESGSYSLRKNSFRKSQKKEDYTANWSDSNNSESSSNTLRNNNLRKSQRKSSAASLSNINKNESDSNSINKNESDKSQRKSNSVTNRSNESDSISFNKSKPRNSQRKEKAKSDQPINNDNEYWSNSNESESTDKQINNRLNKTGNNEIITKVNKSESSASLSNSQDLSKTNKLNELENTDNSLSGSGSWGTESDFEFQPKTKKNDDESTNKNKNLSDGWYSSSSSDQIQSFNNSKKTSLTPDPKKLRSSMKIKRKNNNDSSSDGFVSEDNSDEKTKKKSRAESYRIKAKDDEKKLKDSSKSAKSKNKSEKVKSPKNNQKNKKEISDESDDLKKKKSEHEKERKNSYKIKRKDKSDDSEEKIKRKISYKIKKEDRNDESEEESKRKISCKIKRNDKSDESEDEIKRNETRNTIKNKKNEESRKNFNKNKRKNDVFESDASFTKSSIKNKKINDKRKSSYQVKRNTKSDIVNEEKIKNSYKKKILDISSEYEESESINKNKNKENSKMKSPNTKAKQNPHIQNNKKTNSSEKISIKKSNKRDDNSSDSILKMNSDDNKANRKKSSDSDWSYESSEQISVQTKKSNNRKNKSHEIKTKYSKNYKDQQLKSKNRQAKKISDYSEDSFGSSDYSDDLSIKNSKKTELKINKLSKSEKIKNDNKKQKVVKKENENGDSESDQKKIKKDKKGKKESKDQNDYSENEQKKSDKKIKSEKIKSNDDYSENEQKKSDKKIKSERIKSNDDYSENEQKKSDKKIKSERIKSNDDYSENEQNKSDKKIKSEKMKNNDDYSENEKKKKDKKIKINKKQDENDNSESEQKKKNDKKNKVNKKEDKKQEENEYSENEQKKKKDKKIKINKKQEENEYSESEQKKIKHKVDKKEDKKQDDIEKVKKKKDSKISKENDHSEDNEINKVRKDIKINNDIEDDKVNKDIKDIKNSKDSKNKEEIKEKPKKDEEDQKELKKKEKDNNKKNDIANDEKENEKTDLKQLKVNKNENQNTEDENNDQFEKINKERNNKTPINSIDNEDEVDQPIKQKEDVDKNKKFNEKSILNDDNDEKQNKQKEEKKKTIDQSSFEAEKALATAERLTNLYTLDKKAKSDSDNEQSLTSTDGLRTFVGTNEDNQSQLYKFDDLKKKFEWDSDSSFDMSFDLLSDHQKNAKESDDLNEVNNKNSDSLKTLLSKLNADEKNQSKPDNKNEDKKGEFESKNENIVDDSNENKEISSPITDIKYSDNEKDQIIENNQTLKDDTNSKIQKEDNKLNSIDSNLTDNISKTKSANLESSSSSVMSLDSETFDATFQDMAKSIDNSLNKTIDSLSKKDQIDSESENESIQSTLNKRRNSKDKENVILVNTDEIENKKEIDENLPKNENEEKISDNKDDNVDNLNKSKRRRKHRREGESNSYEQSDQTLQKSRIPKKNRSKEEDEALHHRYSSRREKSENSLSSPRRRRHRSPTPDHHSIKTIDPIKHRSKSTESVSENNKSITYNINDIKNQTRSHHHRSIPVSSKRATTINKINNNRNKPPIPTNVLNSLNETVSTIVNKSHQKVGANSPSNNSNIKRNRYSNHGQSDEEPIQRHRRSERRSESLGNLNKNITNNNDSKVSKHSDSKLTKSDNIKHDEKKKIMSSRFTNSDSFEKPKLILQEKPLTIEENEAAYHRRFVANKNIDEETKKVESAKPMHVTFEIDFQTLLLSREKTKPKNPVQRPPWNEFPLKNLSKPKDSSRVTQLNNEYSLEKLMNEVDQI